MIKETRIPPVIKWSGSKRPIAQKLGSLFPKANRFFEPFVGSGAVLPYRPTKNAVASDICVELIGIWEMVRNSPNEIVEEYRIRWKSLDEQGHEYYYHVRDSFNRDRSPMDLLFLTRTCVNGLIRFNSNGDFNNSFHHTRKGISPERFDSIVHAWHKYIKGVTFVAADYRESTQGAKKGDVVFLDPPYAGNKGRYMPGSFDIGEFYDYLEELNRKDVRWVLTLDGSAAERNYNSGIPSDIYKEKLSMGTGNSPFTKLMRQSVDKVIESVYLNFDAVRQASLFVNK